MISADDQVSIISEFYGVRLNGNRDVTVTREVLCKHLDIWTLTNSGLPTSLKSALLRRALLHPKMETVRI